MTLIVAHFTERTFNDIKRTIKNNLIDLHFPKCNIPIQEDSNNIFLCIASYLLYRHGETGNNLCV